jgi:hypothetical protein
MCSDEADSDGVHRDGGVDRGILPPEEGRGDRGVGVALGQIIIGAALVSVPFFVVLPLASAFNRLGRDGVADPAGLAGEMSQILWFALAGIVTAPVGIALIILGVAGLARHRREGEGER